MADPLGGSWFVEELTDEMERQAEAIFAHVEELGDGSMLEGALVGIEEGYYQSEISRAAYELERKLNDGRHTMVGVTDFLEGNDEPPPEISDQPGVRRGPAQALGRGEGRSRRGPRRRRARTLAQDAAEPTVNLMPGILDAVDAYATVGEIMGALADVFGRHREVPVI